MNQSGSKVHLSQKNWAQLAKINFFFYENDINNRRVAQPKQTFSHSKTGSSVVLLYTHKGREIRRNKIGLLILLLSHYSRLVTYMSSGTCHAHVLAKPDAIADWRSLMGPTKVIKTRFENPETIRGKVLPSSISKLHKTAQTEGRRSFDASSYAGSHNSPIYNE